MNDADKTCVVVTLGDNSQADMDKVLESLSGARVLSFADNIGNYHDLEEIKSVSVLSES